MIALVLGALAVSGLYDRAFLMTMKPDWRAIASEGKDILECGVDYALHRQLGHGLALFKPWIDGDERVRPELALLVKRRDLIADLGRSYG